MTLAPGTQIDDYTIIAPLGAGGMGDVYKARDARLNRTVAIKVLRTDLTPDAHAAARLEREAMMIAGLNHPHICVLHGVGTYAEARYLVMEFLDGETLADRLRKGALPEDEALRYAGQLAAALAAAHDKGIVHRDLKPGNVIITRTGVKLLDFGLAKPSGPDSLELDDGSATVAAPLTETWQIVGTLPYMSPERLQGRPSDARGDVFAFGALLYEMLAGSPAFGGETQAQIVASVLTTEPRPIPRLSAAVDRVIRRCLAKDPADRWYRMSDVAEALLLASAPPMSGAPERRTRRWAAGVAAVTLAAAAAAYVFSGTLVPARPVVVLMDSTLPERVYDPVTRQSGGTNSDDISDTLSDLPVELHKETTSAPWHREDQIVRQHPALVMMHLSSFATPVTGPDEPLQPQAEERTKAFLGFVALASPATRFLVYSRGFATEREREAWVAATVQRFPALQGRLHMLHVPGDDHATFRDPQTRLLVHREVEALLRGTR